MWDFFETVRHRHSVRSYQTTAIEKEKLHAILEMACAAPSAGDLQAYQIVVVSNTETRAALRQAADDQTFIAEAPVCLAFCADPERSAERFGARGRDLYALQDATIAATFAQLATVAAGLASTWVGYFDEQRVSDCLGLDETLRPIALLCIGYPAELPEPSSRRRMTDVIRTID
jgi:nitroreductase